MTSLSAQKWFEGFTRHDRCFGLKPSLHLAPLVKADEEGHPSPILDRQLAPNAPAGYQLDG